MKEISISGGYVALVDDEDFERVSAFNWFYAVRTNMIYATRNGSKPHYLHRFIMNVIDSKIQIDHINHDGLDCRKENLRACSNQKNSAHARKRKTSMHSQYKGVTWNHRSQKWTSRVHPNGRQICLGYFRDEIEAAKAYDKAATVHYGEYAVLNFP